MSARQVALLGLLLAGCQPAPQPPKKPEPAPAAVKITHFYGPGIVSQGGSATICYGVENAVSVTLSPAVGKLTPSFNRCFAVKPARTAQYTLRARGKDGGEASQSIVIRVAPASKASAPPPPEEPLIHFFLASATSTASGIPVTICYGVRPEVTAVTLQPGNRALPVKEKNCFLETPAGSTTLELTAATAQGKSQKERLAIEVR
jgi:hypothetical protein